MCARQELNVTERDMGMEPKGNTRRNLLELVNEDSRSRHELFN